MMRPAVNPHMMTTLDAKASANASSMTVKPVVKMTVDASSMPGDSKAGTANASSGGSTMANPVRYDSKTDSSQSNWWSNTDSSKK